MGVFVGLLGIDATERGLEQARRRLGEGGPGRVLSASSLHQEPESQRSRPTGGRHTTAPIPGVARDLRRTTSAGRLCPMGWSPGLSTSLGLGSSEVANSFVGTSSVAKSTAARRYLPTSAGAGTVDAPEGVAGAPPRGHQPQVVPPRSTSGVLV